MYITESNNLTINNYISHFHPAVNQWVEHERKKKQSFSFTFYFIKILFQIFPQQSHLGSIKVKLSENLVGVKKKHLCPCFTHGHTHSSLLGLEEDQILDFSEEAIDSGFLQETLLSSLANTSTENIFKNSSQLLLEAKLQSWLSVWKEFRKSFKGREQGRVNALRRTDYSRYIRKRVVVQFLGDWCSVSLPSPAIHVISIKLSIQLYFYQTCVPCSSLLNKMPN